jgi:Sulfatase
MNRLQPKIRSNFTQVSRLIALFALALSGSLCLADIPARSMMNVLFIAVDNLRPELGCYGKDYIQSPNIDALARQGMVFERAYTMRTERYRFTIWVARDDHSKVDAIELYDHQVDPQENYNIAKKLENAQRVSQLTGQWKKCWQGAKSSAVTSSL